MLPFTWEPTARRGRAVVAEQQVDALHRSSAVMASGTVLRRAGMRRAAGAAVGTSLLVELQDKGQWHPVTSLAGPCATQSLRDATTSCTAPMGATRRTAQCVSPGPFIVTVTGQYLVTLE